MNRQTNVGNTKWYVLFSLIATLIAFLVFLTGKNLPDLLRSSAKTPKPTSTLTLTLTFMPTPTLAGTPVLVPSITPVSSSSTIVPSATPTNMAVPTWSNPGYFPEYCDENENRLPCIYMPTLGDSWNIVAKKMLDDNCRWPEIANLNRAPTGEYRGV